MVDRVTGKSERDRAESEAFFRFYRKTLEERWKKQSGGTPATTPDSHGAKPPQAD